MDDEQFELLCYLLDKKAPLTFAEIKTRDYLLTLAKIVAEEMLRILNISQLPLMQ
jgi:hypothetical protein